MTPTASSRGLLIVLEGIEGSGKTTQFGLLCDWLVGLGLDVQAAREPGGTAVGEAARHALLHSGEVPVRAELMLMLASRAALVEQIVEPALARGAIVLLDRFELSSFAYQGYGRGLPLDAVKAANAVATGGRRPDLTIVLDVPGEAGEARRTAAGKGHDRIEAAGRAFHERVARGYLELARNEQNVALVDGTGSVEEVQQRLRDELRRRFPETIGSA